MNGLEKHLEIFRVKFQSHRVRVNDDSMSYKVERGYSDRAAIRASELINSLNLPLVAVSTVLFAKDSFLIKSDKA